MAFEKSVFIKPDAPFVPEYRDRCPAPLLRRRFTLPSFERALIRVCGLGYGQYWLNGQLVTEDRFIAPVADYDKTLWYTEYDVTGLLREGENLCAAALGNGFFNESFASSWHHNKVPYRDNPKLLLELVADGEVVLTSDESWLCLPESATTFNMLRSGEYFDARLYDPAWNQSGFDDSAWPRALVDDRPPKGILRPCECEPIRECAVYPAKAYWKVGEGRYVFDIGQNIMGYVRLRVHQPSGDEITIRYAERIHESGEINRGTMGKHYPESPFMTDRYTCDGCEAVWSPSFVYHGFQYVELAGLRGEPELSMVSGVFAHQAVALTSEFECSDASVNRLFEIGRMATLSNLAYMPTDCPTREKLGWANDAQSSCEQMLLNFGMEKLLRKWLVDIEDAMREDGALPGIIPTSGWGYEWGNGPVSDGILFEVPEMLYLFTGDPQPLIQALPWFHRYLEYLNSRAGEDGLVDFGLSDWAPPRPADPPRTPVKLINAAYQAKFLRITARATRLAGDEAGAAELEARLADAIALYKRNFLAPDGTCLIDEQTAVAMTIYHDLYDDLTPLKGQLLRLVEQFDFHHDCGMVGLRRLYGALDICGASEYAYRVITAKGYPGYMVWLDGGATTLWETWQCEDSHNHHMYSDFMGWLMRSLVGIRPTFDAPGFEQVVIQPAFVPQLSYAKGALITGRGRIAAEWRRQANCVKLRVSVPSSVCALVRLPDGAEQTVQGPAEVEF